MGKIRNSIVAIICVLVFSLTACGSDAASSADSSGKVQKTQNTDNSVNADQEKEDKTKKAQEGIPDDLLPAGESEETGEVFRSDGNCGGRWNRSQCKEISRW